MDSANCTGSVWSWNQCHPLANGIRYLVKLGNTLTKVSKIAYLRTFQRVVSCRGFICRQGFWSSSKWLSTSRLESSWNKNNSVFWKSSWFNRLFHVKMGFLRESNYHFFPRLQSILNFFLKRHVLKPSKQKTPVDWISLANFGEFFQWLLISQFF